jgi:uracil-DNA glycosylase
VNVQTELKEILSHMRGLLKSYEELGVDPPPISADSLRPPDPLSSGDGPRGVPRGDEAEAEVVFQNRAALLEDLRTRIGDCQRCRLYKGRTHLVFGEGSPEARLVFVGEGPGYDEDMAGRPFVGESGKLLTRIIENGMGLTRQDVYICNVVKCHPPQNRDPDADEIETCIPFLREQLRIIKPDVICTLGRVAAQALLGKDFKITQQRGQWRACQGIPLMPTFHPAYLLRNASAKRAVWEDIKQVMRHIGLEVKPHG